MTTKKTTNDKLFKGQCHIYSRMNTRFNRVESLIDDALHHLEGDVDTLRCDIDDLNEEITTNTATISAEISALRIAQPGTTARRHNSRDRLQHSTRQGTRPRRLPRQRSKTF